MTTRSQKLIHL